MKIGFMYENQTNNESVDYSEQQNNPETPRASLVDVYFPDRHMTCTYYNDSFNLRNGDLVYVDGKLSGMSGRVVGISYSFKIKLSDYKRIIGVADTEVYGEFHFAAADVITFDRSALPFSKVKTWFRAPDAENEEYVSGNSGESFLLSNLNEMNVSQDIFESAKECYFDGGVSFISLDGQKGYAVVEGSRTHIIEFEYNNGVISNLVCDCYRAGYCKHSVAAMLKLCEIESFIEKNYNEKFKSSESFAAVSKRLFFGFIVSDRETGGITLTPEK